MFQQNMQVQNNKYPILYLSFNQDGSCISIGTKKGFKVFNAVPFKPLYQHDFSDGCSIVSMLYRSSILAISGAGNNIRYPKDCITLYDDQSGRNLGEVDLHKTIQNVCLTREKIFIGVDGQVLVHNITDLRRIDQIDTCPNPEGLLAVQGEREVQLLCHGAKPGEVVHRQYSGDTLQSVQTFQCHETIVRCAAFSPDGQYFATASHKGTLIRVFSTKEKKMLKELRRGSKESAIFAISFSQDNTKIACTSDHGTVHVFSAADAVDGDVENKKSGLKFLSKINKYFDSEWSFGKYQVECPISVCRFVGNEAILVLCADGQYFKLKVNKGELIKEAHDNMLAEK